MAESVFSKQLLVHTKRQGQSDRSVRLLLSVELHTSAAPLQTKYLQIQLTDEEDNFFLYSLQVDEEDFRRLKDSQGLLVDFPLFPRKLNELLNLCLNEEAKETPKFILQFLVHDNYGMLNIVETNPFKHLIHLSLKLQPGDDSAIKNFLSDCLKEHKGRNEVMKNKLESMEGSLRASLASCEEHLARKTDELTRLKMEWDNKLTEMNAKSAQVVTKEKESNLKQQTSIQQRYQMEKRDLEQAHLKIVKQLEARVFELDTQNKELTESRFLNDASIRDLTSKLSVSEDEVKRLRSENQSTRNDANSADSELRKQERLLSQLKTQVAVLETQLKDKETVINKNADQISTEQQQKRQLEGELASLREKKSQMEVSIKTLSDEVLKANEIIRKLQQDTKQTHAKMKLRSQITLKQEEVLKDKETQLEREKTVRNQLEDNLDSLNKQFDEATNKLTGKERELSEALQKISSNENVITWLNKQLDAAQSGSRLPSRNSALTSAGFSAQSLTASRPQHSLSASGGSPDKENSPNTGSKIPHPIHKSTPLAPVTSEEGNENITPTPCSAAVEAKYLPANVPPLPMRQRNTMYPTIPQVAGAKTRISKEAISGRPGPSLANAYFPHTNPK